MSAQQSGSMKPPRKLHIKSYGCQMNVYDAQRMVDTLAPEGFVETASVDDADLVILNTCHIREKASEKGLFRTRPLTRRQGRGRAPGPHHEHRGRRLRRAGRRPGDHPPRARRRRGGGTAELSSFAGIACPRRKAMAARWRPNFRSKTNSGFLPPPKPEAIRARGISSFVTMQEGCDKFCTFCVVPYTRGAEDFAARGQDRRGRAPARRPWRARNHPDRPERQRLSRRGTRWADHGRLARCCVTAGRDCPASSRLRYSTSHPRDIDDTLIEAHRDLAGGDAVRAPSRAVRLRPDSGGHEPQTYRCRLPPRNRPFSRRPPRHCIFIGFYRGLSRRDRGRFCRHPRSGHTNRIRWRLFVQVFAAARHAGGGHAGDGVSGSKWTSDWRGFRN